MNAQDLDINCAQLIDPRWHGKRVAVAMSGGVDSSVAAILCARAGCEVIGLTMKLWDYDDVGGDAKRDGRCCTVEAFDTCRAIAVAHDFPHYTIDLRQKFNECVIGDFVSEYRAGRTPNPCAVCNIDIKWGAYWEKARALGCEAMATGHYAILTHDADGRPSVQRGADTSRDQTYFLWGVPADLLSRTIFPLGTLMKDRVREIARQLGLPSAETPESRDICFVDDQNLARFFAERNRQDGFTPQPGPIRSRDGEHLGEHEGIESYTIGQRKGLGVALGRPQYVTAIDPSTQTIEIGDDAELFHRKFTTGPMHWLADIPQAAFSAQVQIRYRHAAAPATVTPSENSGVRVVFDKPQRAITPGQSAVIYDGDRLLGGAVIDRVGDA